MRIFKTFLFVTLIVGFIQGNLDAKISSRVEGIVTDKDTGKPIEGAELILYSGYLSNGNAFKRLMQWETVTDSKGYYKFEISFSPRGTWYIKCSKKGYISFLPLLYYAHSKRELIPEIYKMFSLEEGQVKHLKIELERGGTLKGKVFKKELSGITPFSFVGGYLKRKSNPDESCLEERKSGYRMADIEADENGEFEIDGILPYENYYISFILNGYPGPDIGNIKVNKNKVEAIEVTLDLIDQTGIEGIITVDQQLAESGSVYLLKDIPIPQLTRKDGCRFHIHENGKYSCKGLNPGKYKMRVVAWTKSSEGEKNLIVDIQEGVTKIMNIDF